MFDKKGYEEINNAIKEEVAELSKEIDTKQSMALKALRFLNNKILPEVHHDDFLTELKLKHRVNVALSKASIMTEDLYHMGEDLEKIKNFCIDYKISFLGRGLPAVGLTPRERESYKEDLQETQVNLDKAIHESQTILANVHEKLATIEIHFGENMFSEEDIAYMTTGKAPKKAEQPKIEKHHEVKVIAAPEEPTVEAVKEPEKQETVEDKRAAFLAHMAKNKVLKTKKTPVKKEAEDKKATFFAQMKTFLTNAVNVTKNTIANVTKKITQEAVKLKEQFFAKMKSFLAPARNKTERI